MIYTTGGRKSKREHVIQAEAGDAITEEWVCVQ
jgi:hypothetical protein